MATVTTATPYDSAKVLFGASVEPWLNSYDAMRIASYKLYEDIYFNNPDTFKLVMRGTNDHPIYVPSGKIIVNTINRYVCRDFQCVPNPAFGVKADQEYMALVYEDLFKRERFYSRFNTNKLYGIMRGDACWLITANSDKPEGTRISVEMIDPASVFRVEVPDDDRLLGFDIIEQLMDGTTAYIKRQRYLKTMHPDHPNYDGITEDGEISYQVDSFEVEGWEDPEAQKTYSAGENLAVEIITGITRLPVYHWKNFDQPENPWGVSELRGLETLIAGVNQAASDQDLALAIAGLGTYVTDAGAPVDEDDNEVPWGLGPAEVVEIGEGKKFTRLGGITTVDPSLNHIKFLQDQAMETSGASDVARGKVEVQMAESGIALKLRMGPILDEAGIKERLVIDCNDQMLFDLRQWFDVYEGIDFGEYDLYNPKGSTVMVSKVGDKLPEDQDKWLKQLMEGYNAIPAIFSGSFVRAELRRMGRDIPSDDDIMEQIATEAATFTAVTDPGGGRLEEEAGDEDGEA